MVDVIEEAFDVNGEERGNESLLSSGVDVVNERKPCVEAG
jgi:hypothetical protein